MTEQWQRRGLSSKNGLATVLFVNPCGPGKVIEVDASPSCESDMSNDVDPQLDR